VTLDTHRNYSVFLAIAGENWLSLSWRSCGEFRVERASQEEGDQTADESHDSGPDSYMQIGSRSSFG
jgi:hypothetical protein